MSSGRDRERDRRAQAASARTNEYFVPKDGIDREVITADICRYLGNDALVRPGNYENPQTRQVQAGYFITAYRNLTTAMIADLKADSERWEAERRATASRGQPSNVEYRASTTHQSRQYYGPTEAAPAAMQQYAATAATGTQQGVYDNGGTQYQQQSSYAQPATGYAQPQGYAVQDNNYYVAGADMAVDQSRSGTRIPTTQTATVPRSNVQYSATPTYQQDSRSNTYYSPQPGPVVSSTQFPQQPTDPYYGRAVPVTGTYDPQDPYVDNRQYQDTGSYSQAPLSTASSATATSGSQTSGTRDRDRERSDRERHHRSRR
jgi:hypothetical protein